MKQGALIFDERTDRYDIRFDLADYYGGLHCGECFDVMIGGKWRPTRIEMAENWYLVGIRADDLSGLRVRTLPSTDEGVAFLVDAPSARIYHAGDLNRWHWEEENEEDRLFNLDQQKRYAEAMERLAGMVREDGRQIDLAFVPLDNRLKEPGCWYGIEEFQEAAGARYLFPMHLFGDPGIIERLKERSAADAWKDRVLGSGKPGERFLL